MTGGTPVSSELAGALPRVLVVSANPFSRSSNNGLLMSTLFDGWPTDKLAQIFVPFVAPLAPDFDVCQRMWALLPTGLQRVEPQASNRSDSPRALRRAVAALAQRPAARRLAHPIREAVYLRAARRLGPLREEVTAFAPQLIVSTLGSLSLVDLVLHLAADTRSRVVPFITDDWATTEYVGAFFSKALRIRLLDGLGRILRDAPVRLVLSPMMAEAYAQRYGEAFISFAPCVDAARFSTHAHGPRPKVRLIYAGQLGLERWRGLTRIGLALATLSNEGVDAELVVYAPREHLARHGPALSALRTIRLGGSVGSSDLPEIYRDADILVHVETFDPTIARYTRYSLSTKLSEYLMSGRPIFAFGPPVSSIRYAAGSGAGITVELDSDEALLNQLRRVVGDADLRLACGLRGREYAMEHHEGVGQRERFRETLRHAAAASLKQRATPSGPAAGVRKV